VVCRLTAGTRRELVSTGSGRRWKKFRTLVRRCGRRLSAPSTAQTTRPDREAPGIGGPRPGTGAGSSPLPQGKGWSKGQGLCGCGMECWLKGPPRKAEATEILGLSMPRAPLPVSPSRSPIGGQHQTSTGLDCATVSHPRGASWASEGPSPASFPAPRRGKAVCKLAANEYPKRDTAALVPPPALHSMYSHPPATCNLRYLCSGHTNTTASDCHRRHVACRCVDAASASG
jgi:hypothetical protein